ncbi:MAG: hypothetical protein JSU01_11365 [Bacteroidetes bacterium]|nr:hypothetical protein [Bacteroidota bacterium]
MKYYPLYYSAKIWLSSVVTGPFIAMLIACCTNGDHGDTTIYLVLLCPPAVILVVFITFFIWLVFWLLIRLIVRIVSGVFPQKCWITFAGMVLTIGLFYLVENGNPFLPQNEVFPLMIGYTAGICAGVWYFDLAKPVVLLEL